MHSYFATQGKLTHAGGWYSVTAWACSQIQINTTPVKILKARPGQKQARVVAEVTPDGIHSVQAGRQVAVRSLHDKA